VKLWIRDLHFQRFGTIVGEAPMTLPKAASVVEYDEEAACIFGEQQCWEDYYERNAAPTPRKKRAVSEPAPLLKPIPPADDPRRQTGWTSRLTLT